MTETNSTAPPQSTPQNVPINPTFVGINGEVTGLGFASRDHGAKNEEDQGLLEFVTLKNDKTHESMKLLIDLKNIFSRQLPKMPKEYISKLVFDRNHESLVILKEKSKIIGGICYRVYPTQHFAEIAFLAVTAVEQVKGYGTRLMNKYKDKMQKLGMEYLLTYADNYAIGYFKKQGFSKEHRMPPERWKGYIKDYDGGTFMECYIHPSIDYCNISNIIKEQKNFVLEQVKKLCINDKVFVGLSFPKLDPAKEKEKENGANNNNSNLSVSNGSTNGNNSTTANGDKQEKTNTAINVADIPGIVSSGWTYDDYLELIKSKERSFYLQCMNIIETMRKHKSSWPFLEPVNKEEVVDYYDLITDPIDIKTIEKRLHSNYYSDKEKFNSDINKIFTNARYYNQPETIYYKCANELESFIQPYLHSLKDNIVQSDDEFDQSVQRTGRPKCVGVKKKISKTKN